MIEYSDGSGVSLQEMKILWKKAFGDDDRFVDTFFGTAYAPQHCRICVSGGTLAGMLFWFDCELKGQKLAYIYGVATDPAAQGQGIASGLLENVHSLLKDCGYQGAILVPGSEALFRFYEKRGYSTVSTVGQGQTEAAASASVERIDAKAYAIRRRALLPNCGIRQEGRNLEFLAQLADCYAGEGFIAAISKEDKSNCMEFLGNPDRLAALAGTLGCDRLRYRMPGKDRDFAMGIRFDGMPWREQVYFGLAFD